MTNYGQEPIVYKVRELKARFGHFPGVDSFHSESVYDGHKFIPCILVVQNTEVDLMVKAAIKHDAKPYETEFLFAQDL